MPITDMLTLASLSPRSQSLVVAGSLSGTRGEEADAPLPQWRQARPDTSLEPIPT